MALARQGKGELGPNFINTAPVHRLPPTHSCLPVRHTLPTQVVMALARQGKWELDLPGPPELIFIPFVRLKGGVPAHVRLHLDPL